MTEDEIAALEDESAWNLESAEPQTAAPATRRAVVSVGFKPGEFSAVAAAAREARQPVSQFIRNAAIERATGKGGELRRVVVATGSVTVDAAPVIEVAESTLKAGKSQLRRRMLIAG